MATPLPPMAAYALARRCSTCGVQPGEQCNAPNKTKRLARADRIRAELGMDPIEEEPTDRMHAARYDAGNRHRHRDITRAPWAEDREPGRRYDTLGDAWAAE